MSQPQNLLKHLQELPSSSAERQHKDGQTSSPPYSHFFCLIWTLFTGDYVYYHLIAVILLSDPELIGMLLDTHD